MIQRKINTDSNNNVSYLEKPRRSPIYTGSCKFMIPNFHFKS